MSDQPASDRLDVLLAQLEATPEGAAREWLALQFTLERLPPDVRAAVWAAAIPHWFDPPFLSALLDISATEASRLYGKLQALSVVETYPERGHALHERARALLLAHLWENDRERCRALSRRAAAHCAAQEQADTLWRVETIYHLLIAEPADGRQQ